jgi:phosphatidylglycerophosphatase A
VSGAPQRATARFMLQHPAHVIALGFGSGLAPRAPGPAGTLAARAAILLVGVWACTLCAQHLGVADPGAIVWDEVIAFWAVLWLIAPAGWSAQLLAFALFRCFDAAKPGPVGWADRLFKPSPGTPVGWTQGFGIHFDDLVAAACTLLLMLPTRALWT